MGIFQRLFNPSTDKSTPKRPKPQGFSKTFILEPILTPSAGLIDDDIDVIPPSDVETDPGIPHGFNEPLDWSGEGFFAADGYLDLEPASFFEEGVFTVDNTGQVSVEFLYDGGSYYGEVAIFSLEGLDPEDPDFMRIAMERSLSSSDLGHVVITDASDAAKFSGSLGEGDWNSGTLQPEKSVAMRPGDRFGIMLIPNGTVQQALNALNDNLNYEDKRPLFSLGSANPLDGFHVGQIADVTGDGNIFVMEDQRFDTGSDHDYNDIIFRVKGAFGQAVTMDDLIDQGVMEIEQDWRYSDLGQEILDYAQYFAAVDPNDPSLDLPDVDPADQPLIGIIDTGMSGNNPDLNYDNITWGSDHIDGDDDPTLPPNVGNEHGTHIAGIIGAIKDNETGIDGVNDDAPLWVSRSVGSGKWADALVEFVDHARESNQPNAVVNLSMDLTQINPDGSVTTRYEFTPMERAAIEYARQNNVLIVAAAGNDGDVMSALGQASQEFDNIVTVGAAERISDAVSASQAFVRADYSSYGYGLDIMAPGGSVESPELSLVGEGVGTLAGTSVATAKVTGAASQVWAANPQLSYRQVIEILKATATDLQEKGWDAETGFGLLNVLAAVQLARNTKPEAYEVLPTLIPETWSGEGKVTPSDRAAATEFMGKYYEWKSYTIKSGDTLSQIALNTMGNGTAPYYNFIANKNGIADPDLIYAGQTILVPSQVTTPTQPQPQPIPQVPINSGSANYRNGAVNPFAYAFQGQCTWFAYGRMLETSLLPAGAKSKGLFLGHAYKWEQDARNIGLPVTATPTAGARGLVVWPPGVQGGHKSYGHVAFLEEVYPDGRIRISESNWAGKGISERILTPAQYNGLRFVQLENARANVNNVASPGQPGQSRQYIVKAGDTLWGIAQRELGSGTRWREIMKTPTGGTFTEAEAKLLQIGQSVYLPVNYQTGTGTPVTPPPSSTPGISNINWVNFSGSVGPSIGVNLRYSPRFSDRSSLNEPYGKTLEFDAWTYGEVGTDMWTGQSDARWFKIKGKNLWVPSCYIWGNPPNSSPMPGGSNKPIDFPNQNGNKSGSFNGYRTINSHGQIQEGDDWEVGKGQKPSLIDLAKAASLRIVLNAAVSSGTLVKGGNPLVTLPYYDDFYFGWHPYKHRVLNAEHSLSKEMRNHPDFKDKFENTVYLFKEAINIAINTQVSQGKLGDMSQLIGLLKSGNWMSEKTGLGGFSFTSGNLHVLINGTQKREIGLENFSVNYHPTKNEVSWYATAVYKVSDDFGFDTKDSQATGPVASVLKPGYEIQKLGVGKPYAITLTAKENISGTVKL